MFLVSLVMLSNILLISGSKWSKSEWCDAAKKSGCAEPNEQHRVCAKGPKCKATEPRCKVLDLTREQKDRIVDVHNKLRNDIALGNDKRMPEGKTAANMLALSWDNELEVLARCHGSDCIRGHDKCRQIPPEGAKAGQNYAMKTNMQPVEEFTDWAVNAWYDEIKDVSDVDIVYDAYQKDSQDHMIGHFTAVIWAKTESIGCAAVIEDDVDPSKRGIRHLYCDYLPTGNVLGTPIFVTGPGASQCPPDKPKNAKYPGLCGEIKAASRATTPNYLVCTGLMLGSLYFHIFVMLVYNNFYFE